MKVRFGICTDLHTEYIHDSVFRVEKFLQECKMKKCDFCIQLGDFCPPGNINHKEKEQILDMIKNTNIPFYHVLGNHDMDNFSKEEVLGFLGCKSPYYSFDCGGLHFIVLDTCYFEMDGKQISYNKLNYRQIKDESRIAVLSDEVIDWLKKDLEKTQYPSVLFSHHSLIKSFVSIINCDKATKIIKNAPRKVILAACGHEHVDRLERYNDTYYWCVNSMSYYWAGGYDHSTYGEEIEKNYPLSRCVFPYEEPPFAIVDVNDETIKIKGKNSKIVGEKPEQLNFYKKGLVDCITATIMNREIKL